MHWEEITSVFWMFVFYHNKLACFVQFAWIVQFVQSSANIFFLLLTKKEWIEWDINYETETA